MADVRKRKGRTPDVSHERKSFLAEDGIVASARKPTCGRDGGVRDVKASIPSILQEKCLHQDSVFIK